MGTFIMSLAVKIGIPFLWRSTLKVDLWLWSWIQVLLCQLGAKECIRGTSSCSLEGRPMELRTYTGDSVKPTGFCNVTVQNRGHSKLPIYVIKNEGPTLLGREWLESIQLDWPLLQLETSDTIPTLEDVLSKHSNVFSEGLGKMKNIQALIQLRKRCSALILESFKPAVNDGLSGWRSHWEGSNQWVGSPNRDSYEEGWCCKGMWWFHGDD